MTPSRRDPQRETATNAQLLARLQIIEEFLRLYVRLAPDEWKRHLASIAERLKGDRT